MMKDSFVKTSLILLGLNLSLQTFAQNQPVRITGIVVDENNEPLIGAGVFIQNSKTGTYTNVEGKYVLNSTCKEGTVIVFSYIGMKKQQVTYKGQKTLRIVMQRNANVLSEAVVTAKSNINELDIRARSGVVQTIDMKQIVNKPMIDMGLALQGSVPGLIVANTGELGTDPQIRIRGNSSLRRGNVTNEPLYVMDGQVISPETFYNLNPNDIKEIKVLKDAVACALYGIKAANGVLEITSQRGCKGENTITFNMNMGVTTRGRRGVQMMNSAEKLELERLLQNTETPGYRYSADYYNKYFANDPNLSQMIAEGQSKLDELRNINTDWYKELLRTSIYQKYNLSMRGGGEKTSYYLSANYTNQGGRIPGNDKQRMSMRMNLDQKLGKIGYMMLSVSGGYAETDTPNGTSNDPAALVYQLNPYETKTGKLWSFPNRTYSDLMNQYQAKSTTKDASMSGNLALTPLPGLDIAAVAGVDVLLDEKQRFTPSSAYAEQHSGIPEIERGIFAKDKNVVTNLSSNVRLTYNHVFAEHHDLTIGANVDYYMTHIDNVGITGFGVGMINSAGAINHSLSGNRKPQVSSLKHKSAQIGLGTVLGYTFKNTYDIYGSFKADASSLLPSDKRWNTAWAVGLSWTPTNYKFLQYNDVLTDLNLRASYGYTANLNGVDASATMATFSFITESYENSRPLVLNTLFNKDLKPEQTKSVDVGLSMGFFNRFRIQANWYNRRTEQALLSVPIPSSTGYTVLTRNIGILRNQGIEFGLDVNVIDGADWRLNLSTSLAYNNNKVLDLYYTDKIYASDQDIMPSYEIGKSYDMLYGPQSLGINPMTGYPEFLLPNGEIKQGTEELKAKDVVALGHLTPPYSGSANFSLGWKGLELSADFYYVFGGIRPFNYSYVRTKDDAHKNAVAGQTQDMWFKPGDEDKTYGTPFNTSTTGDNNIDLYPNSRTVGKSNYIKLSMLSLRYQVPYQFLKKHIPFIHYATIGFQGSNLFTWTPYRESDPESGSLAGTMQPVYTFNLNLTF